MGYAAPEFALWQPRYLQYAQGDPFQREAEKEKTGST